MYKLLHRGNILVLVISNCLLIGSVLKSDNKSFEICREVLPTNIRFLNILEAVSYNPFNTLMLEINFEHFN